MCICVDVCLSLSYLDVAMWTFLDVALWSVDVVTFCHVAHSADKNCNGRRLLQVYSNCCWNLTELNALTASTGCITAFLNVCSVQYRKAEAASPHTLRVIHSLVRSCPCVPCVCVGAPPPSPYRARLSNPPDPSDYRIRGYAPDNGARPEFPVQAEP